MVGRLQLTQNSFHHELNTAPEPDAYITHCVLGKMFKYLFDFDHQFSLSLAGRAAGAFFKSASLINNP